MNRRYMALLLVALLLPCCLAVPVSADEIDNNMGFINLLDYNTISSSQSSGNFFWYTGSTFVYVPTPVTMQAFGVDILVQNNWIGDVVPSITISFGNNSSTINGVVLGNNLVRYSGAIPEGNYDSLSIYFNGVEGITYYSTMLSCNLKILKSSSKDINASVVVSAEGHEDKHIDYVPGSSASVVISDDLSDGVPSYYVLADGADWKHYDYIDLIFSFYTGTVESVSAVCGGISLPTHVAYLNDPSGNVSSTYISVRIDLTGIDRSAADDPLLIISGNLGYKVNLFSLMSCCGHVLMDVNPLFYYFRSVTSAISSLGSTIGNYFSTNFSNLSSWISNQTASIGSFISTNFNNLNSWISNQTNSIVNTVATWGQNIVDAINPDKDTSAADTLKEQGQQIQQFEQQHQAVLESGTSDLQSVVSSFSGFATALDFVGDYTTKVFYSLGAYQVIFTLPLTLGFILFICSRVPYNTKPRKNDSNVKNESTRIPGQKAISDTSSAKRSALEAPK